MNLQELVEVTSDANANEVSLPEAKIHKKPKTFIISRGKDSIDLNEVKNYTHKKEKITGYSEITIRSGYVSNFTISLTLSCKDETGKSRRFEYNHSTESRFKKGRLTSNGLVQSLKTVSSFTNFFQMNSKSFKEIDKLISRSSRDSSQHELLIKYLENLSSNSQDNLGFTKSERSSQVGEVLTYVFDSRFKL